MSRADELRLITRIAQMYYADAMKQSEIAATLHIPQARISRLLKRAIDENIVKITITPPPGIFADLETRIRNRFGIEDVVIAESMNSSEDSILAAIGDAAAHFFETTLADHEIIGISSWSSSLLRMVDAIAPVKRVKAGQVIQIMGGIGSPSVQSHAQHLVTKLAQLTGAEPKFLPAPGVAGSPESKQVLLSDPFVQEALRRFANITLALVGIGSMTPSKMLVNSGNVFTRAELDELAKQGAVGDMGLRFFNARGEPVITALNDRVIGMELEEIKAALRVVAVAGGLSKVPAIRAAVKGGYVDVLITDYLTAQHLLSDDVSSKGV
jgi:DNA-binding transcriptional regulator LsrR (DeoR family)